MTLRARVYVLIVAIALDTLPYTLLEVNENLRITYRDRNKSKGTSSPANYVA